MRFRGDPHRDKLCPGAEKAVSQRREKVTFINHRRLEEKYVGSPGAGGAPGKLFPGAGEKSHSVNMEEKCLGFPGAGGSCVPAPGKLFPAPGKSHIHLLSRKMCRFSAPGEAVSRRRKVLERV